MLRASDLYDLAECAHRVALDRRLPRSERAEPDAGTRRLLAAGLALEARVARDLGWPEPEYPRGDLEEGARATRQLMEQGVAGIYQGVLLDGDHLAIPDLLERAPGSSALGGFHYVAGDVKAGLSPRADQVLQVSFAGALLARLQGRAPETGFLILGDRRRETFRLDAIAAVSQTARARVAAIAAGEEITEPFLSEACGRCRWRERCVPELASERDLSLVDGMTLARRRVLRSAGVTTVEQLAGLSPAERRAIGGSSLGLPALVEQARALVDGALRVRGHGFELPELEGALLVATERNPLDEGRLGLVAWGPFREGAAEDAVLPLLNAADRRRAARHLLEAARSGGGAILAYGAGTLRDVELLCEEASVAPETQATLERRTVNLQARLRRGAAFLPVRRYELEQVAAVVEGGPLPDPLASEPPAFLGLEELELGVEGADQRLQARGLEQLARLRSVARFMGSCGGGK